MTNMKDVTFVSDKMKGYKTKGSTKGSIIQENTSTWVKYNLGKFESVKGTISLYTGGTYCRAISATRTCTISWSCGSKIAITRIIEPSTCNYMMYATLPCCDVKSTTTTTKVITTTKTAVKTTPKGTTKK